VCGDIGKLASGCRVFLARGFGGRNRVQNGKGRNDAVELFIVVWHCKKT
jgi:hypothetical protein